MALVVEDEVKGLKEWVIEAGLIVGEGAEVKSQVLKIIEIAIVTVMLEVFLWYVYPLLEETPRQVSKILHIVEEGS